jgi:hypothetical protein
MWGWFARLRNSRAEIPKPELEPDSAAHLTSESLAQIQLGADPGDVVSMANLGTALYGTGDRAGALHWLGKAWDAGNAAAGFNLGTLHSLAGDTNRAQVIWEQSAALGDPDAMLGLVKQALERRDLDTVDHWAPVIHAQDEAFPITALGVAFRDHGHEAQAVRAFLRAEELGDAYAMEYRARILAAHGAHEDAAALRSRATTAKRMM